MFIAAQVLAALVNAALVAGRLAIVISAPTAEGQPPLRYAQHDAEGVAAVLRELGGFDEVRRLHQPDAGAVRAALDRAEKMAAADPGLELFFYYSGHADVEGMLLGAERFTFDELRARFEHSRAAVRVAMLDACHAGSIVRPKGGVAGPGYVLDVRETLHVRGAAIISASTAAELAQESGDIGGSYFTHHVLSALRGAGDRDANGLVTLAEAYQYAYSHTLAATLPSVWGPQHPSYDYRLSGTGDLVITRLAPNQRALSFAPAEGGRSYVVTTTGDEIMAEVMSRPGQRVRLMVPPGRYRVIERDGRRSRVADVSLGSGPGPDTAVDTATFRDLPPELALAKGVRSPRRHEMWLDLALSGLGPGIIGSPEVGLGYQRRGRAWGWGPHLAYGGTDGDILGVPFTLRRWTATALLLRRVPVWISEMQLGMGAGVALLRQTIGGEASRSGWAPMAMVAASFEMPFSERFALRLQWGGGVHLLRVDDRLRLSPELQSSLAGVLRL